MSQAPDRGEPRGATEHEQQDPEPTLGAHMLEQILAISAGGLPQAGFVEPADVQALVDVARQLAGRGFALDPVAIELVHAMLRVQFEKAGIDAPTMRSMAEQIAATLCDDPMSRERLEALWLGLSQK